MPIHSSHLYKWGLQIFDESNLEHFWLCTQFVIRFGVLSKEYILIERIWLNRIYLDTHHFGVDNTIFKLNYACK